ncbi:MAG: MFS transporter [Gemmataceae bacterium]|nr:MFS transporter [Gemmataceae bacterium]
MKLPWLNRTVIGTGLTSFLADLSYEAALGVLPAYLNRFGVTPLAIGLIEGSADAIASFVKLGAGWWSDAVARRKPFAVAGYVLTAIMPALIALAVSWPLIAIARLAGWFGKGLRGPARDALLAASISQADRGKAFGLHRAGDTCGAVLGPLLAAELLARIGPEWTVPERAVLWWSVVPGALAVLAMALLVREVRGAYVKRYRLGEALRSLPTDFRQYLVSVGVFGMGDCSPALLNAAAILTLAPIWGATDAAVFGLRLLSVRHLVAAVTAFPAGWLSDHWRRPPLLAVGYFAGAATMAGFAATLYFGVTAAGVWLGLFALHGLMTAMEETLEGSTAADFVADQDLRGTAFGALGAVNGFGDFVASAAVGALVAWRPAAGFCYSAAVMFAGAGLLAMSSVRYFGKRRSVGPGN